MKLYDLVNNLNKGNSLEYLRSQEINTPDFYIYKKVEDLEISTEWAKGRISIRTYKPNSRSFKDPHYPNHLVSQDFKETLIQHMKEGYYVIVAIPINPDYAVAKGNIAILAKHDYIIEYSMGKGTVRDMENTGKIDKRHLFNQLDAERELGRHGINIIRTAQKIFWGKPIVLEWSIYRMPVGRLNNQLIFWEIRTY